MTPTEHWMLVFLFVFQVFCIFFALVRGILDGRKRAKQLAQLQAAFIRATAQGDV